MLAELDDYDWREAFGEPETCNVVGAPEAVPPGSPVATDPVTREDVETIIAMASGERDAESWIGVFLLRDGRFAAVESGCDYTGWD